MGTALGVSEADIFAGFPGDLFVILVGVTFLFAIASNNGTVDWLVHGASGAVVPGAVAIVVPIALGFAIQYEINPVLMGLMVICGATAGGFSPISVFGAIVNGVVERNDLEENAMLLRHPRRADPARRAVPGDGSDRRGRPDHRAVDRLVGGGREPVLHQRRPDGREHAGGATRVRLQAALAVGPDDGGDRAADRVAGVRGAGLVVVSRRAAA